MAERRCAWRGIGFELTRVGIGDAVDPGAHDLFYMGGGQVYQDYCRQAAADGYASFLADRETAAQPA